MKKFSILLLALLTQVAFAANAQDASSTAQEAKAIPVPLQGNPFEEIASVAHVANDHINNQAAQAQFAIASAALDANQLAEKKALAKHALLAAKEAAQKKFDSVVELAKQKYQAVVEKLMAKKHAKEKAQHAALHVKSLADTAKKQAHDVAVQSWGHFWHSATHEVEHAAESVGSGVAGIQKKALSQGALANVEDGVLTNAASGAVAGGE